MNVFILLMTPIIVYCYDAYCGWCYGFSPVISRIYEEYSDRISFETLSGGMIPVESAHHIGRIAPFINESYKRVEQISGVHFGEDFLWHIKNPEKSDWHPSSEKPAIAMAVFRDYYPDDTVVFAADLQQSLHLEGRDLTDNEAYRHLLIKYEIPEDEFYTKLGSAEYKEKAYYDFTLVKQLQVTAFPAVLFQEDELKFHLLARGYTDYDTLKMRIEKVLTESKEAS
jgi:putative protein-disulfide isomerase